MNRRQRTRIYILSGALALGFLLAGCKGVPTTGEKAARKQAQSVIADYRPGGQKPALPVLTTNSTLSDLLRFAMLNQPKVEVAYFEWMGSVERITSARSLPDPQITFQMDIQDIVTSIMPGLMMNFPAPGKLHAGAEVATMDSQAKYFAFQSAVLESAYEVKRAYYQLYFLEEKLRVSRENLNLSTDLEQLARAQNQVGKVTLQDVLRAQIELARLNNEITNIEDSRNLLREQYKASLGLKSDAAAPPLPSRFESTPMDVTADKVLQTIMAQNTRLKALESEVHAAEAAIILAQKGKLPDYSAGVMADVKMSPTLYRPLATITLPIWRDKIAAQIAEAQANKNAAEARLTSEQISLAVAFAERSFLYRQASRNLALLNEQLLPRARQSLDVARNGYLSSQIDFFNLSDTERTLLGFQLEFVEASAQRELALAEISLLLQGMPPSNQSMPSSASAGMTGRGARSKASGAGMNKMQ